MSGGISGLIILGVLALVGAPIALSIRGTRPEWTGLLFESVVIGLIVELMIAVVAEHANHYSLPAALVLTLVVVIGSVIALRVFGARNGHAPPDLSLLRQAQPALILLATLLLLGAALSIRRSPSYFIFEVGDMGGYVNTANVLTYAVKFGHSPNGFPLFLRATNLLLGRSNTVGGLPALGAMLLLGIVAFARTIRLHPIVAIVMGFLVVVHPVTVWFSLFPVSEALYAPLLLAVLYLLVRARTETSKTYAFLGGLAVGLILLVRGEAMLLAPIIAVVFVVAAAADEDDTFAVQRHFTVTALVAMVVAYAYDVHYTHAYFVSQLRNLLPASAVRTAQSAGLIDATVQLAIAGAAALALVLWLATLVRRRARARFTAKPKTSWRYTYDIAIVVTALTFALFPVFGLWNSILRWGPLLLVLIAIGIFAVIQRPGQYLDVVGGLMLLLVIGAYTVLFAKRVPDPHTQIYYLYFDRYLFSEVMPAALVFAAVALQVVVDAAKRYATTTRAFQAALVGVVIIVVIGLIPQMDEMRRATQFQDLGNSYQTLSKIDQLTHKAGADPIVYSGSKVIPDGWFFPNTYRAFALPLQETFDRRVVGVPTGGFAHDRVFTPTAARVELQSTGIASGYLVALRQPGDPRFAGDAHTRLIGEVLYECPSLEQTPNEPQPPWEITTLIFDVYTIS